VDARVILSDLRLRGRHGVGVAERERDQDFVVELECPTDLTGVDDSIDRVLDYRALRDIAAAVIEGPPRQLIETLAEEIAVRILTELRPSEVRVKVTKVRPEGIGGPASIELSRRLAEPDPIAPVELHVPDFAMAKAFYLHLGFSVAREEHGDDGYLVLRYGPNLLAFWPGSAKVADHHFFGRHPSATVRGYGVEIIIVTGELDAVHERAEQLGCVVHPLGLRPWGHRDFRVVDPFGYYLRITETVRRH